MTESSGRSEVIYEVCAQVRPDLVDEWQDYMEREHLSDMLATGCFSSASLMAADSGSFRAQYVSPSRADLERYLAEHADRLRPHARERFPNGISFEREVWRVVATA